jgi:hypothetical protein
MAGGIRTRLSWINTAVNQAGAVQRGRARLKLVEQVTSAELRWHVHPVRAHVGGEC